MLIPIRIDRTSKPPLGTPLRSDGHWSVQGIVGAWAFNEGAGSTAFGGSDNLRLLDTATLAAGLLHCNAAKSGAEITMPSSFKLSLPVYMAARFTVLGTPPANSGYFGTRVADTDIAPYVANVLVSDYQGNFQLLWNDNGLFTSIASTEAISAHIGKTITMVALIKSNSQQLYLNNKLIVNNNAAIGNPTYSGTSLLHFGWNTGQDIARYPNADYDIGWYGHSFPSPQEIASLTANPWQIYEPETVWIEVGGTEAEVPITSASALMMGM